MQQLLPDLAVHVAGVAGDGPAVHVAGDVDLVI
jgi:hypothetical protein